jgi:3D (Asp-Asp-Asp) domain-containing protein
MVGKGMNERKKILLGGVAGAITLLLSIGWLSARSQTPITIALDDTTIHGRCPYGDPEAFLDANGTRISGLDKVVPGDKPGFYVLKHPKLITFRGPGGFVRRTFTHAATVAQFLDEAGIKFGPLDLVEPEPNELLPNSGEVRLTKVEQFVVTNRETIPYKAVLELSPKLRRGQEEIITTGVDGEKEVTYEILYENACEVERKVINEIILRPPIDQRAKVGIYTDLVSTRQLTARDELWMEATAYDPWCSAKNGSGPNRTAMGLKAGRGIVAVDPRVIPLGTRLYIEGYGYALAGDTGGAIKGLRIDLGFATRKEAIRFGRREVKVYILD